MKITDHGFCTYHVEMVTDYMCKYKQERCLDCEYLMSKEVYATVEEAAELLGKSQATIRNWIKRGKLKAEAVEFSQRYGRNYYRYKTWFIFRDSFPQSNS